MAATTTPGQLIRGFIADNAGTTDALLEAACTSRDPATTISCTPGATIACPCGGTMGTQTCLAAGTFGECSCPDSGAVDATMVLPDGRVTGPPAFLSTGDVVRIEIERLGAIEHAIA